MSTINFPFDFDEIPLVGKLVYDSFVKDQSLFQKEFSVFDDDFKARFYNQITQADEILHGSLEGQEIQDIHNKIHTGLHNLSSMLIEIKDSLPDSIQYEYESFKTSFLHNNLDKIIVSGKRIYKTLRKQEKNHDGLTIIGSVLNSIESLLLTLEHYRMELTRLLQSRSLLLKETLQTINHLCATIQDVMEIGRGIHEKRNSACIQEYQIKYLQARVEAYKTLHSGSLVN